ncbi:MAG: 50S ribosomal protein L10, partial [Firmicutes bacterium]|nr:50S ribosomal protein L10 [Bacillota bacterium]
MFLTNYFLKTFQGSNMPLSRSKKEQVVENVEQLLKTSKLTVIARYQGMSVKDMQTLRSQAKTGNTTIKV